jgi:hypothetical protein
MKKWTRERLVKKRSISILTFILILISNFRLRKSNQIKRKSPNPVLLAMVITRSKCFRILFTRTKTKNSIIINLIILKIISLTIDMVIKVIGVKAFAVVEDQTTTDRKVNPGVGFGSASHQNSLL